MILRTWSIIDLNFFLFSSTFMLCKQNLVRYSPLHRLGSKSHVLNTTQAGFLLEEKLGAETMGHCF